MKVVVDTNVLISGFLWEGTPKKVIDKFLHEKSFSLVFSPESVHEFRIKLLKKFQVEVWLVNQWVQELTAYTELVVPNYVTKICRDSKDNMILDTALSGNADYIVTGDSDLLTLGKFGKTKILKPKEFLALF